MQSGRWQWLRQLPTVLAAAQLTPAEQARRHVAWQRNIFLPARLMVASIVLYQFYTSPWLINVVDMYGVIFETAQGVFLTYAGLMLAAMVLFLVVRRFPPGLIQWFVFFFGLADGIFLGGLTVLTGGFESNLYWVYPALIIVNAASIPLATPQIMLNLILAVIFLASGLIEGDVQDDWDPGTYRRRKPVTEEVVNLPEVAAWLEQTPPPFRRRFWDGLSDTTRSNIVNRAAGTLSNEVAQAELQEEINSIFPGANPYLLHLYRPPAEAPETTGTHYVLQVAVLVLLTFCCYGVQVLAAAQRRAEEERGEFIVRGEQVRAAGRLAAEVAHQIKNPLAIINNVTFSLQKKLAPDSAAVAAQIEIIREEVAKADRIITQVMGYAQLTEGRVEKLNVIDELNRAIEDVFPAEVAQGVNVRRDFAGPFPPLLLQRKHFTDAVSNLLQNARDAVAPGGQVEVSARLGPDDSVAIAVSDDGPGVPPEKQERIFEAYYTTKAQGSGLGLAVVKHNTELYGGRVQVDSALGKGAKFTLIFPSKTLLKAAT
jgi:nitrogen-specific signal transduction histidine kinase